MAVVGADGTIEPLGSPWHLSWAVGAGDRWHIASEEAAVRTRPVDDMPVVATAMRVPDGDVAQQVAAVTDGAGRAVAVEFVNETSTPVSLALAVGGSIGRAGVRGSQLLAGDQVAAELDRVPGGAAAVADGGIWDAVRSGPPPGDCQASSRAGLAAAAAVLPLARGVPVRAYMPVRAYVPVDGRAEGRGSPEDVVAGWRAVVSRAAAVELPDGTAVRAWRRGVAAAILAAGGTEPEAAARAAVVLDRVGLPDEADRARAAVLEAHQRSCLPPGAAVQAVQALASRRLRAGRDSGLAELAGPLAAAAGDRLDHLTLEQAATALEAEAPAAARDARRLLAGTAPQASHPRPAAAGEGLAAAVRGAVAFGGDGLAGIEAVLGCLLGEAADHLVVGPALPSGWNGSPLDVHGLATRHGLLSFSVRWHGTRPALLWELVSASLPAPRGDGGGPILRCGLDESWMSMMLAGEALLRSHES